jgi:2-polyprenyl-3-methyl-5-hydroxy-6-metoxy-1,4-benzoquinol methylase
MGKWTNKLFVEHADLFLKMLNQRWALTEELASGMAKLLADHGIASGSVLDLCCGNGRISIRLAKKGFKVVGVDMSEALLRDARKKAKEHKVSNSVTFLQGDVRRLKKILKGVKQPFDVVVNAWTSVGYSSQEDDLSVFRQARELSREGAILFVTETMHSEYLSLKFVPTGCSEIEDMVLMENRKYEPITQRQETTWTFYRKKGNDLKFIDAVTIKLHTYSLGELAAILKKAGWKTIATYGSLITLQPMSPMTAMNIIAKAA